MNVLDLARPEIRALAPYSSARMEAGGGPVYLNANESPWPPFDDVTNANRYPEPQPRQLVDGLADLYGVAPECVLIGRGSDEGIDLLVRAFCGADRDAILISPPTFGMYAVCARIQGVGVVEVPLRTDFAIDSDAVMAAVTPAVKLVFVCAPNNPSGAGVPRRVVLRLAEALAGRAMLVVDEAYIEFAEDGGDYATVATEVGRRDNLVVLRTLSKAHALAGVRIGTLLAASPVVSLLRKLMPPYPIPSPCADAALRALSTAARQATRVRISRIRTERARMTFELARRPCVRQVLPSTANFLSVRLHAPGAVLSALTEAGVTVRDIRRCQGLHDALRVTVGTPAENDRVLNALGAPSAAMTAMAGTAP